MTRSTSRVRFATAVFACVLSGYVASAPDATRAASGPLFSAIPQRLAPADAQAADPTIRRSRYVTVDFSILRARGQRVMLREPYITLDLFPDVTVFAQFDRYDPNRSGVTWVGHVEGDPLSTVTLSYGGGLMHGTVAMRNAVYQIRPAVTEFRGTTARLDSQPHIVSLVNQDAFPPEAPPLEVAYSAAQLAAAADTPKTDSGDVIDVMVVYTPLAAAAVGGTTAINNLINLGVSETNTSYANSGVNQRIRLVHAAQVPHTESSSFSINLNDLRLGNGGLSGVAALRDTHGADLVKMLVHPSSPSACGIAFIMTTVSTAFASAGFSVTDTSCVSPNYTFAHELGHNMGVRHDWFVDSGVTPYSYAHGHVNPTASQRWRTIMAYPDMCTSQGFSCTRLLSWANPDRRYLPSCDSGRFNCGQLQYWYFPGAPMGIRAGTKTSCPVRDAGSWDCDADDRQALNNTALTIANLRQATR